MQWERELYELTLTADRGWHSIAFVKDGSGWETTEFVKGRGAGKKRRGTKRRFGSLREGIEAFVFDHPVLDEVSASARVGPYSAPLDEIALFDWLRTFLSSEQNSLLVNGRLLAGERA